ncbi:MAG: CpsB/CapC family capsule biosynthesis tyrosine phosphatase, partial [Myxococcota bacterium]
MLDIHNHALPEVDDGARSLEEAVAIVSGLRECGFTSLAPSPHHGGGSGGDVPAADAAAARERLQHALTDVSVDVELLPNSEHCVTPELFERMADGTDITSIGGRGRWLLVELPWEGIPKIDEHLFRIQTKGYRVVLAHPERYQFMEPKHARALVERGVKLQLEIGSFVGVYGDRARKRAESLLESGDSHVLASDVHRPEQCLWVAESLKHLRTAYGDALVELGCDVNPRALVDGVR